MTDRKELAAEIKARMKLYGDDDEYTMWLVEQYFQEDEDAPK